MTFQTNKRQLPTSGLASVGVYARGKFCGNLKVCRPFELLRSPARTPSRQPLAVMRADSEAFRKIDMKYYLPTCAYGKNPCNKFRRTTYTNTLSAKC